MKPLVAIVGRPNVGKSTFFNKLAGKRIAIVEDTPGVTRDRIYADVEWLTYSFTLIDTGGIDPYSDDVMLKEMRRQAELAVETSQVILFFVDGRQGLTGADEEVADYLRKSGKPIILVVNKVDHAGLEEDANDFWTLGLGKPITISAANMLGLGDLQDEIVALFPHSAETDETDNAPIQIAIVGRPNVGKSSLVNRILGEDRVMVSDIPGTTRDAIDTAFSHEGIQYNIIDTAGIRRKRSVEDNTIERYSVIRSLGAIRRCDVAVIVIDAEAGVTEQDAHIAGYAIEEGRAVVVVVNKWDLIEKQTGTLELFQKRVLEDLKFMDFAQVIFTSAITGQRALKIIGAVSEAYTQASLRISTGTLNDALRDAMAVFPPPASGKRLKIYYITQQRVRPPLFVLFVNDPDNMHFSYERYLENHFRKTFGFVGTPLKFVLRQRTKEETT